MLTNSFARHLSVIVTASGTCLLTGVPTVAAARNENPEIVFSPLWRAVDPGDGRTRQQDLPYALHAEANNRAPPSNWSVEVRQRAASEITKHRQLAAAMPYSRVTCATRVCEFVFATTSKTYLSRSESDDAYQAVQCMVFAVSDAVDGEFSISRMKTTSGTYANGLLV